MYLESDLYYYNNCPISHQVLIGLLKDFKNPNDKIYRLLEEGKLIGLKKGLYIAQNKFVASTISPFLIANHLHGPSYVSLDYALQHYHAIPESVKTITSVTTKAKKIFQCSLGIYKYTHIALPYYAMGIKQLNLQDDHFALIASPEKALTDKIVLTKGLSMRSKKEVSDFLLEDLRIDEYWLKQLDINTLTKIQAVAPKANSIDIVLKFISEL
jgi:hypothetical protein